MTKTTGTQIEITSDGLRRAFSAYPTGVVAISALVHGEPAGMTVASFLSVSLDPPLVLVSIENKSTTWPKLRDLPEIGLSVLGEHQEPVSRAMSSRTGNRFESVRWTAAEEGAVLIDDSALWIRCSIENHLPAGDHELVLLGIKELIVHPSESAPLVFHGSRYRKLDS